MANETEIEQEQSGQVWGSIAAGVGIGVLVGGALALLFAPKSGTELRADLGDAVEDLKDRAEKVLDDLQDDSSGWAARSRTLLEQTRENLIRSVEAGKDAYAQKRDELSSQMDVS